MSSLHETLVLWDVDHTLIENGGISKETYQGAFEQVVGRPLSVRPVTHGRTDLQIMRELLIANGESPEAFSPISQFGDVLRDVMHSKANELARRGHVLPGVVDALSALADEPNVLQSVLTGNMTENARLKVTTFGLEKWFDLDIGGYGTDDEVRSKLIDASRQKVAAKYGRTFDRDSPVSRHRRWPASVAASRSLPRPKVRASSRAIVVTRRGPSCPPVREPVGVR